MKDSDRKLRLSPGGDFYLFLFPFSYSKHFYKGNGLLLQSDKKGFE